MKKRVLCVLAIMMMLLTACGGEAPEKEESAGEADLNGFYSQLAEEYNWVSEDQVADAEGEFTIVMDLTADPEFLENYYPGLSQIPAKQQIAVASMISTYPNEYVFMECESGEDAAAAAEILSQRVTMQAEGGAMYPESMEAWGKAEVLTNGNFVAMIASFEHQEEISQAFSALFA